MGNFHLRMSRVWMSAVIMLGAVKSGELFVAPILLTDSWERLHVDIPAGENFAVVHHPQCFSKIWKG